MAATIWNRRIDIQVDRSQEIETKYAVLGEALAYAWRVTVLDGGEMADLTGYTALAKVIRPDGATVPVIGTISGNIIEAVLPGPTCAYEGAARAQLWIANAATGAEKVIDRLMIEIQRGDTDTVVDPGTLVETLDLMLSAESGRVAAENGRVTAENGRVTAESTRAAFYVGFNSKLDALPNWRKTTGNPARFYPIPGSALTVKAQLTATQAGSGDPSPSNIRAISPAVAAGGTLAIRRSGKNITSAVGGSYHAQTNIVELTNVRPGMMISAQIYINNTAKTLATAALAVQQRQDSTLLGTSYGNAIAIGASGISKAENIPILANANKVTLVYTQSVTDSADSVVSLVQVEYGDAATAYEAYAANDYTLTAVGNLYGIAGAEDTIANDGGEVYNTSIVSFTGNESWEYSTSSLPTDTSFTRFYLARSGVAASPLGRSSHFPFAAVGGSGITAECITGYSTGGRIYSYILKSRLTGWDDAWTNAQKIAAFKAWLAAQVAAGTPVQVLYQLATPATATGSAVSMAALSALDKYAERLNLITLDNGRAEVGFAEHPMRSIDYLNELTGYGVISGLGVTAQSTPDLTIKVAPGAVKQANHARYSLLGAAALQGSAGDATNPRIDVVYQLDGALVYLTGTATASPVAPTVPANALVLAEIARPAGATTITSAQITSRKKGILTEDWITPTLLNGWVEYSAGFAPKYRKDATGKVRLSGSVKSGTVSSAVFTLPVGYRPAMTRYYAANANNAFGTAQVSSNGSVVAGTTNTHFSLDGIEFYAEQ